MELSDYVDREIEQNPLLERDEAEFGDGGGGQANGDASGAPGEGDAKAASTRRNRRRPSTPPTRGSSIPTN